jgi:riboflavin kinase/FMN adenylyltransferase
MEVFQSFEELKPLSQPLILSIGNFDGVHLGHQSILQHMYQLATLESLPAAILTFQNHPSTILNPNHPALLLTSMPQKLKLLEDAGVDITIAIPFTHELSMQSAQNFLSQIYVRMPFRYLILGYDARLGNDRLGDDPLLHAIANELHFLTEFLPAVNSKGLPISSSRIRKAILNEDLEDAAQCLGRKYSITGRVLPGQGLGKKTGYPTANLSLEGLCYPRCGVYIVSVKTDRGSFPGVANLGIAPTLRPGHIPILETYLLENSHDLYNQWIEVTFEDFIRPERAFASIEELKKQIEEDVKQAKDYFHV